MTPKDPIKDHDATSNGCSCCKAEAAFAKMDKQTTFDDIEPELCFLDNDDDVTQDVDDFRFPSPVKNVGDFIMEDFKHTDKPKPYSLKAEKPDGKEDKDKKYSTETPKQTRSGRNSRTGKTSACSNRGSAKVTKQPTIRSSSVTQGQSAIKVCISIYFIPSSEILEFPSVINFDIITSDDIKFHFHFLP